MTEPSSCSLEPINQFAVVCYIPDPLGGFITRLREELVLGCTAQSHVTILPPRPLDTTIPIAESELRKRSSHFQPFELEIPELRIFEETSVIYAEISLGRDCLIEMHSALNIDVLYHDEVYTYHPHITLAQGFDPATLRERFDLAVRRWKEGAPRRSVFIENFTFVQNTAGNRWIDLAGFDLRAAALVI